MRVLGVVRRRGGSRVSRALARATATTETRRRRRIRSSRAPPDVVRARARSGARSRSGTPRGSLAAAWTRSRERSSPPCSASRSKAAGAWAPRATRVGPRRVARGASAAAAARSPPCSTAPRRSRARSIGATRRPPSPTPRRSASRSRTRARRRGGSRSRARGTPRRRRRKRRRETRTMVTARRTVRRAASRHFFSRALATSRSSHPARSRSPSRSSGASRRRRRTSASGGTARFRTSASPAFARRSARRRRASPTRRRRFRPSRRRRRPRRFSLDAAALAPLAALEAWARSGAPSGLLASGDADGERLVARGVGASEAAALKIIATRASSPPAPGIVTPRFATRRSLGSAGRGPASRPPRAFCTPRARGGTAAARAAETARHLTLTSAGACLRSSAPRSRYRRTSWPASPPPGRTTRSTRARGGRSPTSSTRRRRLSLRPDADPDVVEALFHAAEAGRARGRREWGGGSDDAARCVPGRRRRRRSSRSRRSGGGAAVGARLAAIRFAEATFAAPVDLTIDRSDPAKTQAVSTLPVDGFASGALLPASFFALAKNLAALAGEAEDPAFLEPIANALWTASDSARRVGAESALASALVAALSGAADTFECASRRRGRGSRERGGGGGRSVRVARGSRRGRRRTRRAGSRSSSPRSDSRAEAKDR